MNSVLRSLLTISLISISLAPALAKSTTIVNNQNPNAVIVIPQNPEIYTRNSQPYHAGYSSIIPPVVKTSAKVKADILAQYIQKVTSAKIPIINESALENTDIIQIHVGLTKYVLKNVTTLDNLDDDGFIIDSTNPKNIVIAGPTSWATEFAVYQFIEQYLNVKWLFPGDLGIAYDNIKTLDIPQRLITQQPTFFSRLYSGMQNNPQKLWARRNKMHGRIAFHHNLRELFPPEKYLDSHPNFFPLIKGQRLRPEKSPYWNPCFTAEHIIDEAVKNICKYFAENPGAKSFSLGANDGSKHCQCPKCLAADSGKQNSLDLRDCSDRYFQWANAVVERVLEKYPDKYFGCLAYSELADPPSKIKVHKRIIPYITYDRMKWVDPEIGFKGRQVTRQWEKMCPTIAFYDYFYGSPYALPRVYFHQLAKTYRYGFDHGVKAMYGEAYPNWGEGPKMYLALKLQWDINTDVDAALADWYQRCVGQNAAPYLAQYYQLWENFWTKRAPKTPWFKLGKQMLQFRELDYIDAVTEYDMAKSQQLLENALKFAQTERQKQRAQFLLNTFEYYKATVSAYKADAKAFDIPVKTQADALDALDRGTEKLTAANKRWNLAHTKDPILMHPSKPSRYPSLEGKTWGTNTFFAALDFANDPAVNKKLNDLAQNHAFSRVRMHAKAMRDLTQGNIKPINPNPSFEQTEKDNIPGWHKWVKWKTGSFESSDTDPHTGQYSVIAKGVKRGCLDYEMEVTPEKYYLAIASVKTPKTLNPTATVEFAVTFKTVTDRTVITPSPVIMRPDNTTWHHLAVLYKLNATGGWRNEKMKSIKIQLLINNLTKNESLQIDDIAIYQLN
jgi:hypothetical protein